MRDGIDATVQGIISAPAITTAWCARLDFRSETVCLWTGMGSIAPTSSGDYLLDGQTFDSITDGVVTDLGENSFSLSGSEELVVTMAIPASPSTAISASSVYPNEYQSRPVTIWRALLWPQANPLAPPIWLFRRIRSGSMDKIEITNDGTSHNFALTIESHQSRISNASNSSYLDQKRFDPTDTSQDYAASIANGDPAPAKGTISTTTYSNLNSGLYPRVADY